MSFIGNIAAAQSAKRIGRFNQQLYNTQAELTRRKTEIARNAYNNVDRVRLVKNQEAQYDNLFVNLLGSGAEVRLGDSGYEVLLETKYNQMTDLAIEDFNSQQAYYDGINQSLLLKSKGVGENFKGQLTARAEYFKAVGSMFGNYQSSGSILSG
tara:strand:+ start:923 stop:1384 length:462 start_codon:yes stop_codon:yes gene_type:complete